MGNRLVVSAGGGEDLRRRMVTRTLVSRGKARALLRIFRAQSRPAHVCEPEWGAEVDF